MFVIVQWLFTSFSEYHEKKWTLLRNIREIFKWNKINKTEKNINDS